MMFTFLCGLSTAAHVPTRGAADKGQRVGNWHIEPVGIKPALPPPAIEKGKTRGMQTIETPLIFGLSGSSDIRGGLFAYSIQLPTAGYWIYSNTTIIAPVFFLSSVF